MRSSPYPPGFNIFLGWRLQNEAVEVSSTKEKKRKFELHADQTLLRSKKNKYSVDSRPFQSFKVLVLNNKRKFLFFEVYEVLVIIYKTFLKLFFIRKVYN